VKTAWWSYGRCNNRRIIARFSLSSSSESPVSFRQTLISKVPRTPSLRWLQTRLGWVKTAKKRICSIDKSLYLGDAIEDLQLQWKIKMKVSNGANLDDLEWPWIIVTKHVPSAGFFRGFLYIIKWRKTSYYQRQKDCAVSVDFIEIFRFYRIQICRANDPITAFQGRGILQRKISRKWYTLSWSPLSTLFSEEEKNICFLA